MVFSALTAVKVYACKCILTLEIPTLINDLLRVVADFIRYNYSDHYEYNCNGKYLIQPKVIKLQIFRLKQSLK